jgi:hypothetical protein
MPEKDDVTDTRFAMVFEDLETMLSVVDVDEVGDIETLLMFLFTRPVQVAEVWDDEAGATALEVVIAGNDESIGSACGFPLSVMDLARACAETVELLGAYTRDDFALEGTTPDVSSMSEAQLITALQQALGQLRFFNMMDADH